ncbi:MULTISPECIES: class III extradiol ring-cleavage dioxygenase [unclassified Oceanobacter]|uniref:DODA-type extradiol aromatic ring-opening family dioxygenase n=1 Tax=unclassified Oceanobacter TaxID=2620260 RepID=UPI0027330206|nr:MULTISPECIES: class III extradiol ring-cleavage dioxygenase [unclassified Oceanobacter]MDP2608467.1 class III extradiol ring-cleavage dioxygenase [Oceanobacter sp. 1_MG-2023]MDP2611562.1 class III extradiol ring-cleavage dioxygenase [Oceanobacter sp. 2_MG-2023]
MSSPLTMPTVFIPHGGGPWPFVDLGGQFGDNEMQALRQFLQHYPATLPQRPKALLVISAHWEAPVITLATAPHPPMLYDYYNFPPASYHIQWPAPGAPQLAPRVAELLHQAGFATDSDDQRGYDHGTFVPLKVMFPEADIPVLQMSMLGSLNPAHHIQIGKALQPLRDEGVLIIGSGMSFHNLRQLCTPTSQQLSRPFDEWLQEIALQAPTERKRKLADWVSAPNARLVHPREEHLLPMMVIAGAAGQDPGHIVYNGCFGGAWISAIEYSRA